MRGVDFVFHAAALKQVPSCEFLSIEAVSKHIVTENVVQAAIRAGCKSYMSFSSKAYQN